MLDRLWHGVEAPARTGRAPQAPFVRCEAPFPLAKDAGPFPPSSCRRTSAFRIADADRNKKAFPTEGLHYFMSIASPKDKKRISLFMASA